MKEIFVVLKNGGATYEALGTARAFSSALHSYASQEHVRNGIWDACMSSIQS